MKTVALVPVPFSSLRQLIATVSRFCGRESSLMRVRQARRPLSAGDTVRLALLAPELNVPIDVDALVVARTFRPPTLQVRYSLPDLIQVEWALGRLYSHSEPRLPVSLDVTTLRRRCRLSEVSRLGATFDVEGELPLTECAPDSDAMLMLPHQDGQVALQGQVVWVTPRPTRSRLHVGFRAVAAGEKRRLDDIVYRFRLGAVPWTPRLAAPGV